MWEVLFDQLKEQEKSLHWVYRWLTQYLDANWKAIMVASQPHLWCPGRPWMHRREKRSVTWSPENCWSEGIVVHPRTMHLLSFWKFFFRKRDVWDPWKTCLPDLCEGLGLRDSRVGWTLATIECAFQVCDCRKWNGSRAPADVLCSLLLHFPCFSQAPQPMAECGGYKGRWWGTSLTGNLYQEFTDNLTKPSFKLHCNLVRFTDCPVRHRNFLQ